ncbi:MAG: conjugal transfer protein TraF [Candidatus Competibacteraceae bacterium]
MGYRRRLFAIGLLVAGGGSAEPGFYERNAEGWFWYREPPPAVEPTPELPEPPTPPAVPPPAEAAARTTPALAPLSAAWFRANLERYRDAAIDDPTPVNITAWLYLQRVALDKASRFSEATQRAVLPDPWLDETVRRPLATFAANTLSYQAAQATETVLRQLARLAGLWFFYRADCLHCHQQAAVLEALERQGSVPEVLL